MLLQPTIPTRGVQQNVAVGQPVLRTPRPVGTCRSAPNPNGIHRTTAARGTTEVGRVAEGPAGVRGGGGRGGTGPSAPGRSRGPGRTRRRRTRTSRSATGKTRTGRSGKPPRCEEPHCALSLARASSHSTASHWGRSALRHGGARALALELLALEARRTATSAGGCAASQWGLKYELMRSVPARLRRIPESLGPLAAAGKRRTAPTRNLPKPPVSLSRSVI